MVITLDFETEPIERMPNYPPDPVGFALKFDDQPATYYAWGHHNGENNCSLSDAKTTLDSVAQKTYQGAKLVMHNAKFDIAVLQEKMGVHPNLKNIEDTMIMAFLYNPYESNLSLKPLAEKYLGMAPEERDLMGEWIMDNVRIDGKKPSTDKSKDTYFVKYTAYAPPEIAGPYAIGDVDRTYTLYKQYLAYIKTMGMEAAYAREIALIPLLIENEMTGVRVDWNRLDMDVAQYQKYVDWLDSFIRYHLKDESLNIDSDAKLNKILLDAGILDKDKLKYTATGKYSMSKRNLIGAFKDTKWQELLSYRSQLSTYLNTFMKPWNEMAADNNGFIFTNWNQVKGEHGGARTGRFSSTPNFQNLPKIRKNNADIHERLSAVWGDSFWPLPKIRSYVIPHDKEWCLIDRDYSQQEIRILAHFGATPGPNQLLSKFLRDSKFDNHDFVRDFLENNYGIVLEREVIKQANFGIMYGGGANRVSELVGCTKDEAKEIRNAMLAANPDLTFLYDETSIRARFNEPIRTWGGRYYYVEPSREIKGRMVSFEYKMVNYLIQGSAADCTKQAWLNLGRNTDTKKTYLTVHDEFLVSCPIEHVKGEMYRLKTAMESVAFDLPMKSEGKISCTNWAELEKYDED